MAPGITACPPEGYDFAASVHEFTKQRPKDALKIPRQFFEALGFIYPENLAVRSGIDTFRHATSVFNFTDAAKYWMATYQGVRKHKSTGYILAQAGLAVGYSSKSTYMLHKAGVVNIGRAAPYLGPVLDITSMAACLREISCSEEKMQKAADLECSSPLRERYIELVRKANEASTVYDVTIVALCFFSLLGFLGAITLSPLMMFTLSTVAVIATTSKFFRKQEAQHALSVLLYHDHAVAGDSRRWASLI